MEGTIVDRRALSELFATSAQGRQERQEGGERELEGAESEVLAQEGAARRW